MEKHCLIPKNPDMGLLLLRVTLGILFFMSGLGKFVSSMGPGLDNFAVMVGGSMILAVLVGIFEVLGGLALFTGFMSRPAGVILSMVMIGAIGIVYSSNIMQIMIHLTIIAGLLNITLTGPGNIFSINCKK